MIADPITREHIEQWVGADASAQVLQKLQQYIDLLLITNEKLNLIGPKEAEHIWSRHVLDSAQLYPLLKHLKPKIIMDIGSGAGFPAIILAIMGIEKIILVESIQKKAKFLQDVIDTLGLPAEVRPMRMENLSGPIPDVITGRAVSALHNILAWSYRLYRPRTTFLLLKGEKIQEEIEAAKENWHFEYTLTSSITAPASQVIHIRALRHK